MLTASTAFAGGPFTITLNNMGGDEWSAMFGDTVPTGPFTDVFNFVPAVTPGSMAWGGVVNYSFFGMHDVSFSAADLNGTPLFTGSIPGPFTQNFVTIFPQPVTGPLKLTISGTSNGGSYGGDIEVHMAPIPEPETYAMLLGGFGVLAMLARRRKQE